MKRVQVQMQHHATPSLETRLPWFCCQPTARMHEHYLHFCEEEEKKGKTSWQVAREACPKRWCCMVLHLHLYPLLVVWTAAALSQQSLHGTSTQFPDTHPDRRPSIGTRCMGLTFRDVNILACACHSVQSAREYIKSALWMCPSFCFLPAFVRCTRCDAEQWVWRAQAKKGKRGEAGRQEPAVQAMDLGTASSASTPAAQTQACSHSLLKSPAVCHLLSYEACLFVFKLVLPYLPCVMLCLTFIRCHR